VAANLGAEAYDLKLNERFRTRPRSPWRHEYIAGSRKRCKTHHTHGFRRIHKTPLIALRFS
jgi:hypothetical protein